MMKRVSLSELMGMGSVENINSSDIDPSVKLDPLLENFLNGDSKIEGGDLKLPGEREWKEGDPVIDPTIHPRDLQEMRARNMKPAEHIEPCGQEEADEIYRNLRDSIDGPEIPDMYNILGWN